MGLIARVFEREGIPTVTLTSAFDITERTRPPRAAFLNFPLGNQVGPPGETELQRDILRQTLGLLESVERPGAMITLPFGWPDPRWQEAVVATYRDDAATVGRQRRESEFDERGNFAVQECVDVCSLV